MAEEKLIIWPVSETARITSAFGNRTAPTAGASTYHKGVDISVVSGTPVKAATAGTINTGYNSTSGYWVSVTGDGITTYYRHLSKATVNNGDKVEQGQQIALSGNTGVSTGAHLHFETIVNGEYKDPLEVKYMTVKKADPAPAQQTPAAGGESSAAGAEISGEATGTITLEDIQNRLESVVDDVSAAWPVALACLVAVGLIRRR